MFLKILTKIKPEIHPMMTYDEMNAGTVKAFEKAKLLSQISPIRAVNIIREGGEVLVTKNDIEYFCTLATKLRVKYHAKWIDKKDGMILVRKTKKYEQF